MKNKLFQINTIYINTCDFDQTANFLICKLGFIINGCQIHKKGHRQLDLTDSDSSLFFQINEVINFENVPKIQIGLSLIEDTDLSEILPLLEKEGCVIEGISKMNNHLNTEYYALSVDPSLPEFVIKVNEVDFDEYFEKMYNPDPHLSMSETLIDMIMAYECTPIISAELLDIGFRVADIHRSAEFLGKLGFSFKIEEHNCNQFVRATEGLLYLVQDDTAGSRAGVELVIFSIDTSIHSEFDGSVFTNYDIPIPSFRYLSNSGFKFNNEVFNSEGETISNVGYTTDINGITWEMRSWTKVEEFEAVA